MKYGYAGVSTVAQELTLQTEVLKKEGCEVIYEEKFTGTKTDLPKFTQLLRELQEGDTLVVTKLDRLARNTTEGIEGIENLFDRGIKVHVLNVGLLEAHTYKEVEAMTGIGKRTLICRKNEKEERNLI
ncbi:recombinase family protein [Bacillus nitratireducens]|uniref:Recombinase family protein n=1 Tax=Bacillus nitratireducens TaxID=2026193 RepID=A0ABU6P654_9BACI|nr:recombinase family protein [Bacillus nitratireducens]